MIDRLLREVRKHVTPPLTFIGIDGPGGAGKTSLAFEIEKKLQDVQVVHMDDFDVPYAFKMPLSPYRPVGPDTTWHRVLSEVIIPLQNGKSVGYSGYSSVSRKTTKRKHIKPQGIVIIEGVFAIRRELFSHYAYTIWVECNLKTRIKRAIGRDGEIARDLWEKDWLPMEERYNSVYKPWEYADIIVRTDDYAWN